jgi:nicotinamide-nucleotide amidase
MKSIIITIGDELLIGQVINTNAAFIAEQLNSVGIEVERVLTVADDASVILRSFNESYPLYDVIVVTGGLGPTHDDITRKAVCTFFKADLISSEEARKNIKRFLRERNHAWSDAAENQTLVPRGAVVIPNSHGTAPGEFFEQENKYFIVMPGVPYEMKQMMKEFVVPFFTKKTSGKIIIHRTLKTTGIPESQLAARLGNIDELLQGEKLAFLPSLSGVRLRITVIGDDRSQSEKKAEAIESRIRAKAEKYIYASGEEELEETVGKLLLRHRFKIALAESCTGGMIADIITNVPGSSQYFDRGVIVYSNQSKIDLLNVPKELIEQHGAVSEEVAKAMALGIRTVSSTDIGISTTGIAGPSGGSAEKPVGLVWIGYSDINGTFAIKFHLGGERTRIKERATYSALELLRRNILKID